MKKFFRVKGWGAKSSVCPSKAGITNFFGGISRDLAGISRRCPKSLRKKSLCSIFVPYFFWNFKHLEGADFRRNPQIWQKTEDFRRRVRNLIRSVTFSSAQFGEPTTSVIVTRTCLTFTRVPAKVSSVHQSSGEGAFCMKAACGICSKCRTPVQKSEKSL